MTYEHTKSRRFTPIKQFSIYAENKVGRLNDVLGLLSANNVHIMALSSVDSTDSSMIRLVVDYPEQAMALLIENNYVFGENEVIGVELNTEAELKNVTCALIEAEINIHYIYPFLMRPRGKSGLIIRLEDNDLSMEVLHRHHIKVLSQEDIAR